MSKRLFAGLSLSFAMFAANTASSAYGTTSRPSLCEQYWSQTGLMNGTSRRGSSHRICTLPASVLIFRRDSA